MYHNQAYKIMSHGNKKYDFELLKKPGDSITANTANIYSLKNALRLYSKINGIKYPESFFVEDVVRGDVIIERII